MNVYIWWNITDMQWPCPSGFHIPSKDEFEDLVSIMSWLWFTKGANYWTYLKMPICWYLSSSDWTLFGSWIYSYYACCTLSSSTKFYTLENRSAYTNIITDIDTWYWVSIRQFKDIPVTPDSWWTALYSDKIYHNSTLWLISIKNWNNWITIADKNLWATTVYNSWDTLSESNCWKFYQWGNNYWFSYTWATTTSSTAVDASSYWPWNYYSSSTFITTSPRDSSNNANLRWWVSWLTKELKNAYIGKVYEYSYDFRNKSITALNNDWWSIPEWQSYVTFDDTWMKLTGQPCMLKKSLPSWILSTAKKITLVSSWHNNWYAARFALASVVQYWSSTNSTWWYVDTRTGTRIIQLYGTQYSTSWWFSTWSYTMKSIIDLENKIATLSITWYSDITQSITDAQITNIRNNSPLLYIYSYSASTDTTIYCKDVSVSIQ
jgi:hypothetical protein